MLFLDELKVGDWIEWDIQAPGIVPEPPMKITHINFNPEYINVTSGEYPNEKTLTKASFPVLVKVDDDKNRYQNYTKRVFKIGTTFIHNSKLHRVIRTDSRGRAFIVNNFENAFEQVKEMVRLHWESGFREGYDAAVTYTINRVPYGRGE